MDSTALPCFNCLGNVHPQDTTLHPKGILRRKHFQKLLSGEVPVNTFDNVYVFFGCDYVDEVSVSRQLDSLFRIARQKISRLQRCIHKADNKFTVETSERFWLLRKDVCQFFTRLCTFLKRKLKFYDSRPAANDVIRQVLRNVSDLVIFMSTMNSLPQHVISCMASPLGNKCLSLTYHFVHINLDVRWSLLSILLDISRHLEGDVLQNIPLLPLSVIGQLNLECASPFEQYIFFVLWDVVGMALKIFCKIMLAEYTTVTPFPCTCFKELVILIRQLLDERYERGNKDSFWVTFHRIFQVILQDKDPIETQDNNNIDSVHIDLVPNFFGVNKIGFCWWLLIHFSPLYEIDDCGKLCAPNHVSYKSNYFEVMNLCKLTTQSEVYSCTESQLRCYLRCCLSVCKKWETSMDVPLVLWEYFYKRLNDSFMEAGEISVPGHGKSGLALFNHVQLLTNSGDQKELFTSYQLFLKLLSLQLKKSLSMGSQKEWKYLKGRIFSKFHPRKMKELNISGLHNCFCLFLTMASLTDLEDVASKICDLLDMINPSVTERGKHSLIWRALFALMLICERDGKDIALPAKKMATNFSKLSEEFKQKSSGTMQSYFASELLHLYMEGVQDIFQHSKELNLSEFILIASSFNEVLSSANASDLQVALAAVDVILSQQRMVHQKRLLSGNSSGETAGGSVDRHQFEALADAIWVNVLPFVKEQVLGEGPFKVLADVATGITLLMMDTPPKPNCAAKDTLSSLVQYFGFSLQTKAVFCCEYLINLLLHPDLVKKIISSVPNSQAQIIRAWVRLGIQITPNGMQDLTRLVLDMPEMKKVFTDAELDLPLSDKYSEVVEAFLKALGKKQNALEFNSRITTKQTVAFYFADVTKVAYINFKGNNSPETLLSVYTLVGHLIKTIPSLIYVASKHDCIFCEIVNTTILPHAVYNPDIPIPQALLDTLRDALPQFIVGISTLNYRRDPYISQTLKSIFAQYLPRFSLKASGSSLHPLVVSLLGTMRCLPNGLDVLNFAVEVIRDTYLLKRGNILNLGINFIHELLICCSPKDCATTVDILMATLLKLMLLIEDSAAKQRILDLIKLLIDSCLASDDENCRSSLEQITKEVVKQYFNIHTDRLFNLLRTLAKINLNSIGNLLPLLSEQVNETERQQGCGKNEVLRSKLREFASVVEAGFKEQRKEN